VVFYFWHLEKLFLSLFCIILKNNEMSKVDELRQKYSQVTPASFRKFTEADKTPTKKYLDFMLKAWDDRKNPTGHYRTIGTIIDIVNRFNDLLPYVSNKDIYSKEYYNDLGTLIETVRKAEAVRDERTFVREEHANVLIETDNFLFIEPKTHRGSLKYGANTKWCTTGKNDPATFNRYAKGGLLVYLIDKTETKQPNVKKIAFYHEYNRKGLNDSLTLFNVTDNECGEHNLITGGWNEDELFNIFSTYRYYFMKVKEIKKSKDYVDGFVNLLSQFNFPQLEEHMAKLDESANVSYIGYIRDVQRRVDSFVESLNKSKYGLRKT